MDFEEGFDIGTVIKQKEADNPSTSDRPSGKEESSEDDPFKKIDLEFEIPEENQGKIDPNVSLMYLKKYFQVSKLREVGETEEKGLAPKAIKKLGLPVSIDSNIF